VPITIADVAARARVSKTTVSRVLNNKGELDEETAARVRRVIDELGYVPSARAVGLARGRTRVVGMLVPSLTWPWIGDVVQGAVDVLESEQYGLLLFTCNRGRESMRLFLKQVSAKSFDGLLVIEPEGTLDTIHTLHARRLPLVLIDDRAHEPLQLPSVGTTNQAGAAEAARHLLEVGRTTPLVVSGPVQFGCTEQRLAGFAEVYAAAGHPVSPDRVVVGDFTSRGGREAFASSVAAGVRFDAVFAHNDLSAAGVLHAALDAGWRVPRDVAVVGFDDIPLAAHTQPPLTTVHQPLREMGGSAARMLLAHLDGAPLSDTPTTIPASLVVRGSTVAPERADPTGSP